MLPKPPATLKRRNYVQSNRNISHQAQLNEGFSGYCDISKPVINNNNHYQHIDINVDKGRVSCPPNLQTASTNQINSSTLESSNSSDKILAIDNASSISTHRMSPCINNPFLDDKFLASEEGYVPSHCHNPFLGDCSQMYQHQGDIKNPFLSPSADLDSQLSTGSIKADNKNENNNVGVNNQHYIQIKTFQTSKDKYSQTDELRNLIAQLSTSLEQANNKIENLTYRIEFLEEKMTDKIKV